MSLSHKTNVEWKPIMRAFDPSIKLWKSSRQSYCNFGTKTRFLRRGTHKSWFLSLLDMMMCKISIFVKNSRIARERKPKKKWKTVFVFELGFEKCFNRSGRNQSVIFPQRDPIYPQRGRMNHEHLNGFFALGATLICPWVDLCGIFQWCVFWLWNSVVYLFVTKV